MQYRERSTTSRRLPSESNSLQISPLFHFSSELEVVICSISSNCSKCRHSVMRLNFSLINMHVASLRVRSYRMISLTHKTMANYIRRNIIRNYTLWENSPLRNRPIKMYRNASIYCQILILKTNKKLYLNQS